MTCLVQSSISKGNSDIHGNYYGSFLFRNIKFLCLVTQVSKTVFFDSALNSHVKYTKTALVEIEIDAYHSIIWGLISGPYSP